MSAIEEKIKKIREQERQLELEKKKIEFIQHIIDSAKNYEHQDFAEVKSDVVALLEDFAEKAINAIEGGNTTETVQKAPEVKTVEVPEKQKEQKDAKPQELSPNEKMSFAIDHRHLSGKMVSVANDKNINISGTVVGLDAPFVIVKTETGPTIKVPLEKVSLS